MTEKTVKTQITFIWVDTSTTDYHNTLRIAEEAKEKGVLSLESPVSKLSHMGAENGIPQRIGGLGVAGLTTPVTLAGNLSQMTAEALAGIVLTQLIRPGVPVVLKNSSSCADMKSLGLTLGAPECALVCVGTAQLERFYGFPCRSGGGVSDAKVVDAQSSAESMMNLLTSALSGTN